MASNLRVDTILPSTGTNVAIGTANGSVTFLGDTDITTSGSVSIGGTLTYEDVTNVDSVGVITARNGGYLDIRTGSSINTNATGSAASGTIHKNTNSGEFAIVSGGTGGNNHLTFYTSASAAPTEKIRITNTGQFVVGTNPTVGSGNIVHIEAPTSFNSGETIVNIKGDKSTAGPRLLLQNNNTGASAHGEILGTDAGGQSTSSIRFYNTDQTNNYGEIAFGTRDNPGAPPTDRMRISKEGYVTTPSNVMFAANGGQSDLTNGVFVFSNVLFQRGGSNYNNSNGYFTAPVDGIYMFMCNPYRYADSNDSQISLQKSTNSGSSWSNYHEVRVYTGYGGDSGRGWVSLTMSTLMDLNKNDIVRIFAGNRCHANSVVTVYSGMLVG